MKSITLCLLLLVAATACGGYGSGMNMTPAPNPVITPMSGTYSTPLTVTLTDARAGATIYYTIDGTTPTLSSTVYTRPFVLNASARVEAVAIANGYSTSGVATADYTLQ